MPSHARRTVGIRLPLLATEQLFWHCGAHTAKPESAPGGRFLITKVCCFLWHVVVRFAAVLGHRAAATVSPKLAVAHCELL